MQTSHYDIDNDIERYSSGLKCRHHTMILTMILKGIVLDLGAVFTPR